MKAYSDDSDDCPMPLPRLPTPNKKSTFQEWQDAYNVYATHYARMQEAMLNSDNYRTRDAGMAWVRRMVDASLGIVWNHVYSGTPKEKRAHFWQKLEKNSALLSPEEWDERFGRADEAPVSPSVVPEVLPIEDEEDDAQETADDIEDASIEERDPF